MDFPQSTTVLAPGLDVFLIFGVQDVFFGTVGVQTKALHSCVLYMRVVLQVLVFWLYLSRATLVQTFPSRLLNSFSVWVMLLLLKVQGMPESMSSDARLDLTYCLPWS